MLRDHRGPQAYCVALGIASLPHSVLGRRRSRGKKARHVFVYILISKPHLPENTHYAAHYTQDAIECPAPSPTSRKIGCQAARAVRAGMVPLRTINLRAAYSYSCNLSSQHDMAIRTTEALARGGGTAHESVVPAAASHSRSSLRLLVQPLHGAPRQQPVCPLWETGRWASTRRGWDICRATAGGIFVYLV